MIRKATIKDLDIICDLENKIFPIEPFSKRNYRYMLKSNNCFVLLFIYNDNEKIIGNSVGIINNLVNGISKGRIYSIGVLEEYRSKGIASKLLEATEKYLKKNYKVKYITLEVLKKHPDVVRFYIKRGYDITEYLPKYYEGSDSIRMKKYV